MFITIEHYQVKRELKGNGFNICGSREDLLRVAEEIRKACEHDFSFGWVYVRDAQYDEHQLPNTKALPWA